MDLKAKGHVQSATHYQIDDPVNDHRRTLVPPCVNGDIAIKWERSNFDPSQNPNPLTDYDKTLHN